MKTNDTYSSGYFPTQENQPQKQINLKLYTK